MPKNVVKEHRLATQLKYQENITLDCSWAPCYRLNRMISFTVSSKVKFFKTLLPLCWLTSGSATLALPEPPTLPSLAVTNRIEIKAQPFSLWDVRLLEGPFKRAQELDRAYLLSFEVDDLARPFRINAGLLPKGKALGGWESADSEVRGHFIGHWLSACAEMVASTGDVELKKRADQLVAEIASCQECFSSGYLSAFPEEFFDRLEAGKNVWVPWYTLHKLYQGLLDMHQLTGNQQSLACLKKAVIWVDHRTSKLSEEQMQKVLDVEHGGMLDVLAKIYAVTGDDRILITAMRFWHHAVLDTLTFKADKLTGLHANTQFPKVQGSARLYELTGGEKYGAAATYFWDKVTGSRSYVIGGNSDGEIFTDPAHLSEAISRTSAETCNSHNMLKLTRQLFSWDPRPAYADYYERTLFNHILASQDPADGMFTYYVPLIPTELQNDNTSGKSGPQSCWCCGGTGIENHATHGNSIYFHDADKTLYVNLFIASELSWKDTGLTIKQETAYPLEPSTKLTFTGRWSTKFSLALRHPAWATNGVTIKINGKAEQVDSTPGSYITLTRKWKRRDTVEMTLPMSLHAESFRDNTNRLAFLYGPLVLCACTDLKTEAPVIVESDTPFLQAIKPVSGKPLTFTASPEKFRTAGDPPVSGITLIPFYKHWEKGLQPYKIYWDVMDSTAWDEYKAEQLRLDDLKSREIDSLLPAVPASEQAHLLQSAKSMTGSAGKHAWRDAREGGWISFNMKVIPGQAMDLVCTYWGSDGSGRVFDILINGVKIATQELNADKPDKLFDVTYAIPAALTTGKDRVTVKLRPHPGNIAGGIFGCRMVKAKGGPTT